MLQATLLILISFVSFSSQQEIDEMKTMLDNMNVFYNENQGKFNESYYEKLVSCMGEYDDKILLNAQNNAWMNMYQYYLSNGTAKDAMNLTDHWGRCIDYYGVGRCNITAYMRNKTAMFPGFDDKMEIMEPCNYVSNVAYYHATTRICDYPNWSIENEQITAQKRGFATLAMGSSFWHGSRTFAGSEFDDSMIAVISYLAH